MDVMKAETEDQSKNNNSRVILHLGILALKIGLHFREQGHYPHTLHGLRLFADQPQLP
jgi:hypothetical protein